MDPANIAKVYRSRDGTVCGFLELAWNGELGIHSSYHCLNCRNLSKLYVLVIDRNRFQVDSICGIDVNQNDTGQPIHYMRLKEILKNLGHNYDFTFVANCQFCRRQHRVRIFPSTSGSFDQSETLEDVWWPIRSRNQIWTLPIYIQWTLAQYRRDKIFSYNIHEQSEVSPVLGTTLYSSWKLSSVRWAEIRFHGWQQVYTPEFLEHWRIWVGSTFLKTAMSTGNLKREHDRSVDGTESVSKRRKLWNDGIGGLPYEPAPASHDTDQVERGRLRSRSSPRRSPVHTTKQARTCIVPQSSSSHRKRRLKSPDTLVEREIKRTTSRRLGKVDDDEWGSLRDRHMELAYKNAKSKEPTAYVEQVAASVRELSTNVEELTTNVTEYVDGDTTLTDAAEELTDDVGELSDDNEELTDDDKELSDDGEELTDDEGLTDDDDHESLTNDEGLTNSGNVYESLSPSSVEPTSFEGLDRDGHVDHHMERRLSPLEVVGWIHGTPNDYKEPVDFAQNRQGEDHLFSDSDEDDFIHDDEGDGDKLTNCENDDYVKIEAME